MSLKQLLLKKVADQKALPEDDLKQIEEDVFRQCMRESGAATPESVAGVPRFFHRLPRDDEPLRQKLREETRSNFLHSRSRHLLDKAELKSVYGLLEKHQTYPEEQLISYADYKKVVEAAGPKVRLYFTAGVFARLQQGDPQGRVSIMSLFNYIMKKVWLHQTRIGLSVYDTTGQGYLRENDLENYILDALPTLPQLEGLEKSFHSFYVCTAARKFMFFLDTLRAGRVRILDILACSFLDDLLELRVKDVCKEKQEQNWFSAPSALRVYGDYLNLDRDHNGMLSISDLSGYGSGTLTQPFLQCVFQTCLTYNGEMDYKTYLDLILALENRSEPQSLAFLFRILDLHGNGYLDAFTLNYFFRAIQEQLTAHGADLVSFHDVKDELFDMVKPKDPEKITLDDLIACGKGETFVSILIEFHAFWAYDSRESVLSDPPQD